MFTAKNICHFFKGMDVKVYCFSFAAGCNQKESIISHFAARSGMHPTT
jgi:hypothetical protein